MSLTRKNKKIIAALLTITAWVLFSVSGYFFYLKAREKARKKTGDKIASDITNKKDNIYGECFRIIEKLSQWGGSIFAEDGDLLSEKINEALNDARKTIKISDILNISIKENSEGKLLAEFGKKEISGFETIDIRSSWPHISIKAHLPEYGHARLTFLSSVDFAEKNVGTISIKFISPVKCNTKIFRNYLIIWIFIIVPFLLLCILCITRLIIINKKIKKAEKKIILIWAVKLWFTEMAQRKLLVNFMAMKLVLEKANANARENNEAKEKKIGPYVLKNRIGRGGMAELFIAEVMRENGFRRIVALKKILPHFADDEEFVERFIREARLAARLQHPNVVATNDFGKFGRDYIIVMEYVKGKNLGEIMTRIKKGLSMDQVIFIIARICRGLQYSHEKCDDETGEPLNIVHRDISPQNILISFQGEVKISDFGIAKAGSYSVLTTTGSILGKLGYLTPEQVTKGGIVDQRSDIYALGIVFYEMLTGKRLFRFKSALEAVASIPKQKVKPIDEVIPDIPLKLSRIIMKCLEKDQSLRYQSAKDLLDDLEKLKEDFTITYSSEKLSRFMRKHFSEKPITETKVFPSSLLWNMIN